MESFIAFFLALFSTIIFINLLLKLAKKYQLYDQPGGRKMHSKPVPRLGGLGMTAGASLPIFIWLELDATFKSILMGVAALAIMGLVDDLVEVKWSRKLLVQVAAALIVVVYGKVQITSLGFWAGHEVTIPEYIAIPLSFLFILGITNAINLTDGLDGLAAGLCTFIFGAFTVIAYISGLSNCILALAAILGSIWGFLRFNTYPAIIFMGDAGSYFLGFSAAVFGIICTQYAHNAISPAVVLLILAFPITDTLTVMTERLLSGSSMFMPDRRHIHFKLIRAGLSQRQAVVCIYALQALFTFIAFRLLFYPASLITGIFFASVVVIFGVLKVVESRGVTLKTKDNYGKNSLDSTGNKRFDALIVKISLYFATALMGAYLVVSPLLPVFSFDSSALYFLIIPVAISIGYFLKEGWFNLIYRFSIYGVSVYIAEAILRSEPAMQNHFGMPLWYLLLLATLSLSTILYLKFAVDKNIQLTPLDLLIFLITLAFSVLPLPARLVSAMVIKLFVSMLVFIYASEATLDQGGKRRKILVIAANIGAIIIGIRGAMTLLQTY